MYIISKHSVEHVKLFFIVFAKVSKNNDAYSNDA